MSDSSPIPRFNLNHPKNYIGYTIATGVVAQRSDATVESLLATNNDDGKRITRDITGAADGARELGLVSESEYGDKLTELGQRVISHATDAFGSETDALDALRGLFGRRTRFIEALPAWESVTQEMFLSHQGIFYLINLLADVHANRSDEAEFPLPLVVQELYHRDPQFTKDCFVVPRERSRLDALSWKERGAGSTPDVLWEKTLYRSSLVHQTKSMLWHAGILTTKGTSRASLEFSPDEERFLWGVTDEIRQSLETVSESSSGGVHERLDTEESVQDATPPERVETTTSRIIRNTTLVKNLKHEHDYRCQICDAQRRRSRTAHYAEGHHLHPLGDGGPDIRANVVVVCPTCHADLDYGMLTIEPELLYVQHSYDRSRDGVPLRTVSSHDLGREYIEYHNERAESTPIE